MGNMKSWIRGERFDTVAGYTLIVDEGDGNLSRIPVEVDGNEVKFGDPVPVVEQYTDKALAASAVLAGMKMADPAMIIHASRDDTREGEAMDEDLRKSLAKRLGLADDATEDQIKVELAKPVGETPPPPGTEGDEGNGDEGNGDEGNGEGEGAGTEGTPEGTPAGVSATVTLDRATYDQLKRGATLAESHETDRIAARISETVEAAVNDGRIPPARREHWTTALKADFEGNKAVIDGLQPGLVPLQARGSGGPGGEDGVGAGQGEGLPEEWFPEIRTIRAQANSGSRVTNAKEG